MEHIKPIIIRLASTIESLSGLLRDLTAEDQATLDFATDYGHEEPREALPVPVLAAPAAPAPVLNDTLDVAPAPAPARFKRTRSRVPTPTEAEEITRLYNNRDMYEQEFGERITLEALARRYGVSTRQVGVVINPQVYAPYRYPAQANT